MLDDEGRWFSSRIRKLDWKDDFPAMNVAKKDRSWGIYTPLNAFHRKHQDPVPVSFWSSF